MENQTTPIKINIIVSKKTNKPSIELRRTILNYDLMKLIIKAGIDERPLIIVPSFNDRLGALNSMLDKGILYLKDGEYYFWE